MKEDLIMNRNMKTMVLSVAAVMVLGATTASFAAVKQTGTTQSVVQTTTQAKPAAGPKISQDQASQIATKAHQGTQLIDIKLTGKVYIVHLSSDAGRYTLKIGANTGKILKDKLSKTATAKKTTKK
jgi:uncharacterized membrane protein YkoI